MPGFREPTTELRVSFLAAMAEFAAEGRTGDGSMIGTDLAQWPPGWADPRVFADYVAVVRAEAHPDTPRPGGRVPSTTLWWTDDDGYVGRLAIRHRLNDFLLERGGHIGYDVRRSKRRRGHATAMLRAALPIAAGLGLDRVLVTCDDDNVGSRAVIEANGGVFEDQRGRKLRFWIPTAPG
jgi:predicted acetyltransferase